MLPTGASNGTDVMFARSTNDGQTFSAPQRINDDPINHNKWHIFGTPSVAPNGRIDIVWLDSRNAANNVDMQLFYSYSTDGGVTWAPNIAVSNSFSPQAGYPSNNKIGDYITIVSDATGGNVAYAATFNVNPNAVGGHEQGRLLRASVPKWRRYTYTDTYSFPYADAYCYSYTYCYTDSDSYPYDNCHPYAYRYLYSDIDTYCYTDSNGYAYGNCHRYVYTDGDAYCYNYSETDADAKVWAHAEGASDSGAETLTTQRSSRQRLQRSPAMTKQIQTIHYLLSAICLAFVANASGQALQGKSIAHEPLEKPAMMPPAYIYRLETGPRMISRFGLFTSFQVNVDANGNNILGDAANESFHYSRPNKP